jgi:DNA repair protein SbcC/Rad50
MTNMTAAREAVSRQFQNVTQIGDQVIRGEKLYENKPYAIAYIDLADDIITRADSLREFQERVLGEDFFQSAEQLRWNNYLYIVAGPKSISSDGYLDAKSRIEADKHYARKRVVSEGELVELLGDSKLFEAEQVAAAADIVAVWAERLKEGKLDSLIEQPTPRTAVLENIGKGAAARAASPRKPKALSSADGGFTLSHLEKLEVSKFRPVHDGRTYSFGAVTLIVGANGTGKTSLLEAIEYLYCGHNRRPASNASPRVKGTLANVETGALSTLESTSDSNRIRARCLAWYGRDERQGRAIVGAFTRFNFLDTDAAFRLSSELEPGDISRDLSRLLIGADAATLWDYLGKTQSALETEFEKSSSQIERLAETNVMLERELTQLRNAPSQAKSLSTTYRAAMRAAGWQGALKEDDELVASSERGPLEGLASELAALIALSLPQSNTPGQIRMRAAELAQASEALRPVEQQRLKLQAELRAVEGQSTKVVKGIDTLTKWYDFCTAQFPKALRDKQTAQQRAEASRQKLGALVGVAVPVVDNSFEHVALENAEVSTNRVIEASTASIQALEASEKQFGIWEAKYAKASQQLKAAAKILTEEAQSAHACPVCGTEHSPEDLLDKIEKITDRTASSEPLKELQVQLQAERTRLADAQKRAVIIQSLQRIAAQLQISQSAIIGEIVAAFRSAKEEASQADAASAEADESLRMLAAQGLDQTRFNTLRTEVSLLLDGNPAIDDANSIALARERNLESQTELNAQSLKIRAEYDAVVQIIHAGIEALGLWSSVDNSSNPDYTFDALLKTFERYRNAEMKATKIDAVLKMSDDSQFVELQTALGALISSFDQALHAVMAESSAPTVLREKEMALESSQNNLKRLRDICKNQRLALDVLEKIRTESSLEDATRSALDSIRVQINDVFSRVHSPNEYEYDGYGDNILRTREGHESRSLDEVSTGQRAAFALSIFLALNLTAKSAPPIVLIDDPIAHIDDLNALSFMDYLRDLAVHSRRQVFFATADSRVAALFEKKFAFLGSTKFRKIELSKRVAA